MTLKLIDQSQIRKEKVETVQTIIQTSDTLVKLIIEDGLWIGLMADLTLVSGQLRPGKHDFLIAQREAIITTLNTLTIQEFKIPLIDIGFGNPIGFMFAWLEPLNGLLKEKEIITLENGQDQRVWKALPPFERMLLVLMVPGIFRLIMKAIAGKIL